MADIESLKFQLEASTAGETMDGKALVIKPVDNFSKELPPTKRIEKEEQYLTLKNDLIKAAKALEPEQCLVFNMRDVKYFCAPFIGTLASAQVATLKNNGSKLILLGADANAKERFTIAGVNHNFTFVADNQELQAVLNKVKDPTSLATPNDVSSKKLTQEVTQ